MQNKYKYFFKNFSIFSISNFISKFIMFFMVLLYTNYLTTEEYGTIDAISTLVTLAIPIFTLSISEGIIRFSLEKGKNKKQILNISLNILFKGFVILSIISILALILKVKLVYIVIFLLYYLCLATAQILGAYLKGIEKIKVIGISTIIRVVSILILNCIFLLILKQGIIGYYISYITSEVIIIVYQSIVIKNTKNNNELINDNNLSKEMINYSKHFIVNTIGWWVNNALDKYMLIFFHGISCNGIYSVAYKIPNILEIAQNIFAQTWQISAIKEFESKDSNNFFSNMFNIYNLILTFIALFLLIFLKPIAKILFAKEFYVAWKYVPFLLLAAIFGALSGFFGSIFAANKKSKICSKITMTGAGINLILNLLLIPKYSAYGAAIATCISYFSIFILNLIFSKKFISLNINLKKILFSHMLLLIMGISMIKVSGINNYYISIIVLILIITINYKTIMYFFNKLNNIFKRRKNDRIYQK